MSQLSQLQYVGLLHLQVNVGYAQLIGKAECLNACKIAYQLGPRQNYADSVGTWRRIAIWTAEVAAEGTENIKRKRDTLWLKGCAHLHTREQRRVLYSGRKMSSWLYAAILASSELKQEHILSIYGSEIHQRTRKEGYGKAGAELGSECSH